MVFMRKLQNVLNRLSFTRLRKKRKKKMPQKPRTTKLNYYIIVTRHNFTSTRKSQFFSTRRCLRQEMFASPIQLKSIGEKCAMGNAIVFFCFVHQTAPILQIQLDSSVALTFIISHPIYKENANYCIM